MMMLRNVTPLELNMLRCVAHLRLRFASCAAHSPEPSWLHAGEQGLVHAGFFPASKRGLHVQNLQRALAALKTGEGYLAGLPARLVDELADGSREATLDFLWNLLLQRQVAPPLMLADRAGFACSGLQESMCCERWCAALSAYIPHLSDLSSLMHLGFRVLQKANERFSSIADRCDIHCIGMCSCRCFWTCERCMLRWTASPKQTMAARLRCGCPACLEPKQAPRPQASSWRCC